MTDEHFLHEQSIIHFDFWYTYILFGFAFVFFFILNQIIKRHGTPKKANTVYDSWLWANLCVSLIHGLIVGIWSIISFLYHYEDHPGLFEDPFLFFNTSSFLMMIVSTAYFFYDSLNILVSNMWKKNKEVLVHHFLIITVFVYLWHDIYGIGYTHLCLLSESSSFFLHARKLLRIARFSSDSLKSRILSIINVVAFFIFRLIPLGFCVTRIYPEYFLMRRHFAYYSYLSISVIVIFLINVGFFVRLLNTDFIRRNSYRKQK
ncbi:TLC domain-containing protein 2-like [Mytilus trossulus]|uniref:TLC domain-containing protein 2-like n=1 Tax=Mytilus trossulus TaxID=6551 RepID=UPI00300576A3